MARVRISVLGPLSVSDDSGRDLTPDGALQRRLLALLVLRRGAVVSTDSAIATLWPVDPPKNELGALQNHVSRLRQILPDAIESVATGYRLDPDRIDVDIDRLADVADSDLTDSRTRDDLARLLDRWHGGAYPELADSESLADLAAFEELRTRATERLAEARIAAADTDGMVAELQAAIERDPYRERPRELMMSLLASTGRTVEALRVYDDFRRLVGDELGIEPSPSLMALHADLLAGLADSSPLVSIASLPTPATSLVGREALVEEYVALVGSTRAVTLVGPGGVGKTRLLVEIGHRLSVHAADRMVVLCELATAEPRFTAETVAAALGIDARPGVPPVPRIVELLRDATLTLLIDNCEHVLDEIADLVERVLAACPGVTVVATSRERLRISGEHVRAVPTLLDGGREERAVALFVQRGRAVRPEWEPTSDDVTVIEDIVRHLDGLPLAIELAAARLHTHDLGEVAAAIDQPLTLLTAGSRASTRHGSLHAVVSWSYGLLDETLRRSFDAITVFGGPFSSADAAAVIGIDDAEAHEVLTQLVERSLVVRTPDRRFALLETLRAFGADRLAASGRIDETRARHADRFVAWIEATAPGLAAERHTVAAIDDALPELRAAFDYALDRGRLDVASRIVAALVSYAVLRLRADVLTWANLLIAADPDREEATTAEVWAAAAYVTWMTGDVAGSGRLAVRAVEIAERTGSGLAAAGAVRGNHHLFEGRLIDAAGWYRRAVDASGSDETRRLLAAGAELLALGYAGDDAVHERAEALLRDVSDRVSAAAAYVWYCAGEADLNTDLERARQRLDRAIEIADATHTSFIRGVAGATKASIEARSGDPAQAAVDYRWLIGHWRRASVWATQWTMLRSIASLLAQLGQYADAATLEGAIRATTAGHRIFGTDESAMSELSALLRGALGDAEYEAARDAGARLDGDAAVEHALRCL